MAYDRAAFLARFNAEAEAQKTELAARSAEMARRNAEWLRANGRLPSTAVTFPPPPPPIPRPIVAAPPCSAELEFERVRKDACARIASEHETRRAEKAAVAMILDAYAAFEPADRTTARAPARGSDAEEAAVDLLLSFMPARRS